MIVKYDRYYWGNNDVKLLNPNSILRLKLV